MSLRTTYLFESVIDLKVIKRSAGLGACLLTRIGLDRPNKLNTIGIAAGERFTNHIAVIYDVCGG